MGIPQFTIENRDDAEQARIAFSGAWEAPAVRWVADVMTLRRYREQHPTLMPAHGSRTALMDVGPLDATPRRVTVALPLEAISDAELLKVVIMLRNYRKLREGVRQWSA